MTFEPELRSARVDVGKWTILNEGIKTMPPGRVVRAFLDRGPDRLEAGLDQRYDVAVECDDLSGESQPRLEFVLDIAALYGHSSLGIKGVHHGANALEKIHELLKSSQTSGHLVVGTRSLDKEREA